MGNPLIGQILGSVFGRAAGGAGGSDGAFGSVGGSAPGGLGSVLGGGAMQGGGLGGVLGGILGGGLPGGLRTSGNAGAGSRNAMLALMLPLVLQWVQRSGGIGSVLQRVTQQGLGDHAASWVGSGENQALPPQAAQQLLGPQELSGLSRQLGVGEDEVAHGFAEILPEVVDHLSPRGELPPDADRTLDAGQSALERMLGQAH